MAKKAKARTVLLPALDAEFSKSGPLEYWKQILPERAIKYTDKQGRRRTLNLSRDYLSKCIDKFKAKKLDQTPFLLADKDNAHTMDPERFRGLAKDMRLANDGEDPGLYVKIGFPSKKMAKAVLDNPGLPVSARIRETDEGPEIVHVLGTLDPQVTGMLPWQPADLSAYDDSNVLDLSNATYTKGKTVAKKNKVRDINSYTEADIEAMSAEEIDEFLATYAADFEDDTDVDDEDDDDVDEDDDDENDDDDEDDDDDENSRSRSRKLVGAGAELSKRARKDIELANSVAAQANKRAQKALARAAAAEWREYKLSKIDAGVPPHLLDLAEPVLNRPDDLEVDLSNFGEDDINVAEILRKFIDAAEGTVDLSFEQGHNGNFQPGGSNEDDPDAAALAAWEAQFSSNKAVGEKH